MWRRMVGRRRRFHQIVWRASKNPLEKKQFRHFFLEKPADLPKIAVSTS
jgi:hypothetical protein